jgi:biopolymer transport protein ExbD
MSSDKVKGYANRLITVPGYHIHPQFDLVHLRHLIETRHHRKKNFALMLAPMVDMFSILVIYLLMNFSSSGEIFFVSKDVVLPKAIKGSPLQSFPVISILKNEVMFDAEKVDAEANITISEPNDGKNPQMRDLLRRLKAVDAQIHPGQAFKGQINLQADLKTPVDDIKKVMRVLIEEGWTGINFVVDPRK